MTDDGDGPGNWDGRIIARRLNRRNRGRERVVLSEFSEAGIWCRAGKRFVPDFVEETHDDLYIFFFFVSQIF